MRALKSDPRSLQDKKERFSDEEEVFLFPPPNKF
jgi:hypothetical protein